MIHVRYACKLEMFIDQQSNEVFSKITIAICQKI